MSETPSDLPEGVPFTFFCSLLREISTIQPQNQYIKQSNSATYPALDVFHRWIRKLNTTYAPFPSGTCAICFRLLFPEEDTRRKYDLQETKLAQALAVCLGIQGDRLLRWASEGSSGSLGEEVKIELERTCSTIGGHICSFTIAEVDKLLDELASNSGYSHSSVRLQYPVGVRRSRSEILRLLYRNLSPLDASILTQIILKDMRPVLYPVTKAHYTTALKDFKSNAVHMLTKEHAMKAWDSSARMLRFYRARSNIDEAAADFELPKHLKRKISPIIGAPIDIPKSKKAQGCYRALSFLRPSKKVWAEIKYDGERAQIHVEILADNNSRITIFSKSKRESTLDRHAVHDIIRQTLGLSKSNHQRKAEVKLNVILDAEMVAWHGDGVDEFWRIRRLVEETAHGIRSVRNEKQKRGSLAGSCSQNSIISEKSENRHLALVFFDILFINNVSLLSLPYSERRTTLKSVIQPIDGKAMLSERFLIDVTKDQCHSDLRNFFAAQLANHQEGLVLKAEDSKYNDFLLPWVKLKTDYIPGFGDSVDLAILGASWEKDRARELRVGPGTFTTFYIGVLTNSRERDHNTNVPPHFLIYFTVSYGMCRDQLEEANFLFRNSDHIPYQVSTANMQLPFTFTLFSGLKPPPSIMLCTPLAAELFGAGFTKSHNSEHYELRFPRVSKIYRSGERGWEDCVDLQSLDKIGSESSGKDRNHKDIYDWNNELWGQPVSPSANSPLKRKRAAEDWEEKLATIDREDERQAGEPVSPVTKRRREETITLPVQTFFSFQPLLPMANGTDARSSSLAIEPPTEELTANQVLQLAPLSKTPSCHPINNIRGDLPDTSSFLHRQITNRATLMTRTVSELGSLSNAVDNELPGKCISEALIWFAPQRRGSSCTSCSSWKRSIARDRRLHCMGSLLSGCGWGTDSATSAASWIKHGVILIPDHGEDEDDQITHITWALEEVRGCTPSGQQSKPIWVFSCKTRTLERRNAVFTFH